MKTVYIFCSFLFLTSLAFAQDIQDSSTVRLPEAIIKGNFPAYLQALVQQHKADGVVNVLNLDLPGRFPDLNPAEALQRLPGIVLQRSEGEGRFVHIRGTDPSLSTVQINGEQIVTPEANHRFLQFDLLPVDQLRAVEVWKTNRPDQDGDAVGGSINLLTRQAVPGKQNWQGAVAGGYNPAAALPNAQAQLAFSGKNLVLSGSIWQDHRATDNLETLYGIEENGTAKTLVITDLELRHLEVARRRFGLNGEYTLPFKSGNGRLYLRGMYAGFEEKNLRQRLRYRPGTGTNFGSSDTVINTRIGRDVRFVRETERFTALQTGLEQSCGAWTFDGSAAFSYGLESEPEGRELDFKLAGVDLVQLDKDPDFPKFGISNGESSTDYDKFVLNELETERDRATDRAISGKANARFGWGKGSDHLKFGVKYRSRQKNSQASEQIFDGFTGPTPLKLPELLLPGNHAFFNRHYDFGQYLDWEKTQLIIENNSEHFQRNEAESAFESVAGNFGLRENTGAVYAQIHLEKGRWEWLAGARLELTDYRYTSDRVSIDSAGTVTREDKSRDFSDRYAFLLPSLQAKFSIEKDLLARAAFSASYARPDFNQLAPYEVFNQLDGTVLAGNPHLKPAFSWNVDFAIEKQLNQGGAVSAGVFGKRIEHFIFTQQSRDTRIWGGSQLDVLTTVPLNGEQAWLAGAELAWQQRLSFLPGAWSGLGIYANYTYTWSRAQAEEEPATGGPAEEEEEGFRLPGQAAHSGNLALWYDLHKWSGRIALNGQSDFLLQAAEPEDAESQLIYGGSVQLELNVAYALGRHSTLFAEGLNLLNTPLRFYTGDRQHPSKQEYYGAWGRLGLKFSW